MALLGTLACASAQAGIQLSSTRVIMHEKDRNVSVFAKNIGDAPLVVQAWIDGNSEEMKTPFFVTPPLSRFDGQVERSLNITRVDQEFPADRESLYWLNVLEIPQKTEGGQNHLTLATRTRIKLFYRPDAIKNSPRGADQLKWSMERDGKTCSLVVSNASPYTVNFARIEVTGNPENFGVGFVAAPLASSRLRMPNCPPAGSPKASPRVVNDYGVTESWPDVVLQEERSAGGSAP